MVSGESLHCTISLLPLSSLQTQDAVKKTDVQKMHTHIHTHTHTNKQTNTHSRHLFVMGCIKQVHIILHMQRMYLHTINTDKV